MRFNLISNITNGVGLQQDFELLRSALEDRGHTVQGVQFNQKPLLVKPADVNVFLEVVTPQIFAAAPQQWAVPNPEWWFTGWDAACVWTKVLAKTRDCERIFREKVGDRCQYLGWLARDLYDASVPRERKFLHLTGKSRFKNTHAVIEGCQRAGVPVTIIGDHSAPSRRRISDEELIQVMNSHFCHIMPSAYEGYGHVLHEALGVGQIVITTEAPPMNEIAPSILVPSAGSTPHHFGQLHRVKPSSIAQAVRVVQALSEAEVTQYQTRGRAQFQQDQQAFHQALDALVGRAG
jgi:hypothetical protein